nr:MAG TPA: hypothetical protein [Bacteriophage sp.]
MISIYCLFIISPKDTTLLPINLEKSPLLID